MWLIYNAVVFVVRLFAAVVLVRIATALASPWRPAVPGRPRRDARWLLGWLILLPVSMQIIPCEWGGFHSFQDPIGGDWNFEGRGWPLTVPTELLELSGGSSAIRAICWLAVVVDVACAIFLLIAVRLVIDRFIAAWTTPDRWRTLLRETAGFGAALLVLLLCERLAARPIMLPGTEIMVYSTLIYDSTEVRAAMLVSLASAAYLLGRGGVRGARTIKRLHEEGVI